MPNDFIVCEREINVDDWKEVKQADLADKKKCKNETGNYMMEGMSFGLLFGVVFDLLLFDNFGTGIGIGMCLGLAIGVFIKKKK